MTRLCIGSKWIAHLAAKSRISQRSLFAAVASTQTRFIINFPILGLLAGIHSQPSLIIAAAVGSNNCIVASQVDRPLSVSNDDQFFVHIFLFK